jgi:hypothetical protein
VAIFIKIKYRQHRFDWWRIHLIIHFHIYSFPLSQYFPFQVKSLEYLYVCMNEFLARAGYLESGLQRQFNFVCASLGGDFIKSKHSRLQSSHAHQLQKCRRIGVLTYVALQVRERHSSAFLCCNKTEVVGPPALEAQHTTHCSERSIYKQILYI